MATTNNGEKSIEIAKPKPSKDDIIVVPKENKEECTCASFFTVRGKHKIDCPAYAPQIPDSMEDGYKTRLDLLMRNRIKFIGENEQTYRGTPAELMEEIGQLILSEKSLAHSSGRREGIDEALAIFKKYHTYDGDPDGECEKEIKSPLDKDLT